MNSLRVAGECREVWQEIRSGRIVVLEGVPEIQELVCILNRKAVACAVKPERWPLAHMHKASAPRIYAWLSHINDIIYGRGVSLAIAAILRKYGFPTDGMIEPGRLRVFFPRGYPRIWNRPKRLYGGAKGAIGRGNPAHRDIHGPHRGVQVNFWFPLTDIDINQSVKLFPSLFGKNISTNDRYRVTFDHPELKEWLQVPMKAGDVLVFHSEHLHESPVNTSSTSRISIDCRCVFFADDDNSYYHGGFEDITSFLSPETAIPFPKLMQYALAFAAKHGRGLKSRLRHYLIAALPKESSGQFKDDIALQAGPLDDLAAPPYFLLRNSRELLNDGEVHVAVQFLARLVQTCPFSNDRLQQIVELTHNLDRTFVQTVIEMIVANTIRPFWLVKLGDFLSNQQDYENAARAYARATELKNAAADLDLSYELRGTGSVTVYQYHQPSNQHYVKVAAEKLGMLIEYGLVDKPT